MAKTMKKGQTADEANVVNEKKSILRTKSKGGDMKAIEAGKEVFFKHPIHWK